MILVTGATGTVGSEVTRRLAAKRAPFRITSSSPEKAAAARAKGVDAVHADFAKPETLGPALAGVDTLFLLGSGGPGQDALEKNVVDAAKAAKVARLVKLSVIRADGAAYGFARIHRAVEKAIEASGIPYTFLRPNGFMQNIPNYYADTIRGQGVFYGSAGEARVSHVDAADIAEVAVSALTGKGHEGKAYTITGPEALTYGEIAAKLSAALGKTVSYVNLTDEQSKQGMTGAGIPGPYADLLVDLVRWYRTGEASGISADVETVTGKKPRTFDAFLPGVLDRLR